MTPIRRGSQTPRQRDTDMRRGILRSDSRKVSTPQQMFVAPDQVTGSTMRQPNFNPPQSEADISGQQGETVSEDLKSVNEDVRCEVEAILTAQIPSCAVESGADERETAPSVSYPNENETCDNVGSENLVAEEFSPSGNDETSPDGAVLSETESASSEEEIEAIFASEKVTVENDAAEESNKESVDNTSEEDDEVDIAAEEHIEDACESNGIDLQADSVIQEEAEISATEEMEESQVDLPKEDTEGKAVDSQEELIIDEAIVENENLVNEDEKEDESGSAHDMVHEMAEESAQPDNGGGFSGDTESSSVAKTPNQSVSTDKKRTPKQIGFPMRTAATQIAERKVRPSAENKGIWTSPQFRIKPVSFYGPTDNKSPQAPTKKVEDQANDTPIRSKESDHPDSDNEVENVKNTEKKLAAKTRGMRRSARSKEENSVEDEKVEEPVIKEQPIAPTKKTTRRKKAVSEVEDVCAEPAHEEDPVNDDEVVLSEKPASRKRARRALAEDSNNEHVEVKRSTRSKNNKPEEETPVDTPSEPRGRKGRSTKVAEEKSLIEEPPTRAKRSKKDQENEPLKLSETRSKRQPKPVVEEEAPAPVKRSTRRK